MLANASPHISASQVSQADNHLREGGAGASSTQGALSLSLTHTHAADINGYTQAGGFSNLL